jgi:hypothetical protein
MRIKVLYITRLNIEHQTIMLSWRDITQGPEEGMIYELSIMDKLVSESTEFLF